MAALTFGIPSLIGFRLKREDGLNSAQFLLLPLSQVILIAGFNISYFYSGHGFGRMDILVILTMIAVSVAADVAFLCITRKLAQKEQLEAQLSLLEKYDAALGEQRRQTGILRHEIANHLMTMQLLVREDKEKAEEYADGISTAFERLTELDTCRNRIAGAVLYGKRLEAASRRIAFSVDAVLQDELPIKDTDLMSLLSNLIDNAIESAAAADDPHVSVELSQKRNLLMLRVCNTYSPAVPPDFQKTSKLDRSRHGLGISIVEEICRSYHGSFSIGTRGEVVQAEAILPI